MATIDPQTESDAQVLWEDVLVLLEEEGLAPSTLAMFKSLRATSLTEEELVLATNTGFVKRTVEKNDALVRSCIERAAFQRLAVRVELSRATAPAAQTKPAQTTITPQEFEQLRAAPPMPTEPTAPARQQTPSPYGAAQPRQQTPTQAPAQPQGAAGAQPARKPAEQNPLVDEITENDSLLTFDTFVEGEENRLALQAAKAVANGSRSYNPLFIYGKSGLGKTHLLKAIQNYVAFNDPSRLCVYRTAREFVSDFTRAMFDTSRDVKETFTQNYRDIDILIIDDIQGLQGAAKSVDFFFDTFNYLVSHGKQIILAADRVPSELGMDERVTSRLDSGMIFPVQTPNYELKYGLIEAFCRRMKQDAEEDGLVGFDGTISPENLEFMARRAGTNIRTIKAFCQKCLLVASTREAGGEELGHEDIERAAREKWGMDQRTFTIDEIQQYVEQRYGVSHDDLIGSSRNKDIKEPRHVAIWLCRELTDSTLAQIGKKFGKRSHATVKHSINWVEEMKKDDRLAYDKVERMKERLLEGA